MKQNKLQARIIIGCFLFLMTTAASHGQEEILESSSEEDSKFKIGVMISPEICYRRLKDNGDGQLADLTIARRNDSELAKIGYTAGIKMYFNPTGILGLETGIYYSNKGYKTKDHEIYRVPEHNELPGKIRYIHSFYFIDIPVRVNYTFGKRRVRFFASGGITTNIFIKEKQKTILDDREATTWLISDVDYNRITLSPVVSLGMKYRINSNMSVHIEPSFSYGILKLVNAPVTGYLYSGGLNVSYYFGL